MPIATTLRTGISIFTYCGNVTFGITGDYDTMPDIEVLAHGIENGVAELLDAARKHRPAARKRRTATRNHRAPRNASQ